MKNRLSPVFPWSALLVVVPWALLTLPAWAWDATGHRLSAYVAWELTLPPQREQLIEILREHPRFERDFRQRMPASLRDADEPTRQRWLLGQAAVWPDIARGLPEAQRQRYHRPDWHWIDGAWVRGTAQLQGNVYLGMNPLPSKTGLHPSLLEREAQADNVVTALELQLQRFRAPETVGAERALALSWILHLIGDLHQPLHAGALYTPQRFPDGDRGGNAIRVAGEEAGNLHALWDQALREPPFGQTLDALLERAWQSESTAPAQAGLEPERWLRESREILHETVYPAELRRSIRRHEGSGGSLPAFEPDEHYIGNMRRIAIERVMLSGRRIAGALSDEMP